MESALSHVLNKAHRALALLNHRAKCIGGFHYNTYTMLFNQLVTSQILPTAGHKNHNKITALQIQAMRFFLGVGKTCPIAGLFREMAWVPYRMQIKLQGQPWCAFLSGSGYMLEGTPKKTATFL